MRRVATRSWFGRWRASNLNQIQAFCGRITWWLNEEDIQQSDKIQTRSITYHTRERNCNYSPPLARLGFHWATQSVPFGNDTRFGEVRVTFIKTKALQQQNRRYNRITHWRRIISWHLWRRWGRIQRGRLKMRVVMTRELDAVQMLRINRKLNAENRHHLHPTACHLVPLRARPMVKK